MLRKHRWTIAISVSGKQQVFSAKQRRGKKLATCYIGTSNKLNNLTEEDVVAKINRREAAHLADNLASSGQVAQTDHQNGHDGSCMPVLPIIPARG